MNCASVFQYAILVGVVLIAEVALIVFAILLPVKVVLASHIISSLQFI